MQKIILQTATGISPCTSLSLKIFCFGNLNENQTILELNLPGATQKSLGSAAGSWQQISTYFSGKCPEMIWTLM